MQFPLMFLNQLIRDNLFFSSRTLDTKGSSIYSNSYLNKCNLNSLRFVYYQCKTGFLHEMKKFLKNCREQSYCRYENQTYSQTGAA